MVEKLSRNIKGTVWNKEIKIKSNDHALYYGGFLKRMFT